MLHIIIYVLFLGFHFGGFVFKVIRWVTNSHVWLTEHLNKNNKVESQFGKTTMAIIIVCILCLRDLWYQACLQFVDFGLHLWKELA